MRRPIYLLTIFLITGLLQARAQSHIQPQSGPNDTIKVPAVFYDGEWIPYSEMEMVYVTNTTPEKLAKIIKDYNRLRNAVYATYPYAKTAGAVINDVNAHLQGASKSQRKKYIKSRESDLKKQFSDPLSNLSVYQGKVLMKLINRETGNDCYDLIREYRGGINARMYQTVAFLFGSDLKQEWDLQHNLEDRQIERIVQEIDGVWYNPYRPGAQTATK